MKSAISMRAFFELPQIKAAQDVQKVARVGSREHRNAYATMLRTARQYKVIQYFGKYLL
jgi:hypothetical protein